MALGTLALYYSDGLAVTECVCVCLCVCVLGLWLGSEEIVRPPHTHTKKAEFSFGKSLIKS